MPILWFDCAVQNTRNDIYIIMFMWGQKVRQYAEKSTSSGTAVPLDFKPLFEAAFYFPMPLDVILEFECGPTTWTVN
ncbi:MAG: hypothetical protein IJH64_12695 [Oscillospiraceae bacterium]|nr:hypothetical protein [Oscillospiraceae bacterium]